MAYADKEYQNIASRKHYQKYKERYKGRNKVRIQRNKEFIAEYLKTHHCVDCGNSNPIVLEFDHVTGDKVRAVSIMSCEGWGINKIQEEIDKCEVRCANCHRIITHRRRMLAKGIE